MSTELATLPKTVVTFLLDQSGSMENIQDTTIAAVNLYVDTLKAGSSGGITFSLILFDTFSVDKVWVNLPIKEVPKLTKSQYKPRAGTPLIDAAYKTIKAVENFVIGLGNPYTKVVICIQTDGQENSSCEYTWDQLNILIKEKFEAGWQFNFMGASIDAYKQAQRMGIHRANTMSYDSQNVQASMGAFQASASNHVNYARGASLSASYSTEQKSMAGDKFDPDAKVFDQTAGFTRIQNNTMSAGELAAIQQKHAINQALIKNPIVADLDLDTK